ncbi:glycosyltransferase [Limimaricola sp.]|uniref:glycosyltransferase n=1 Tax=Limimaricola sp. TaxID=2211665 RepID=UPI0025C219AC|nr:glycosyltransferase [Limimaricola sp.]
MTLRGGRVWVEGATGATRVSAAAGMVLRRLDLPPGDVPGARRFQFDIDDSPGLLSLEFEEDGGNRRRIAFVPFPAWRRWLAAIGCFPGFTLACLRALPAAWRWARWQDVSARAQMKRVMGLSRQSVPLLDTDGGLPSGPAAPDASAGIAVTIILPVYEAFGVLSEALDRLLRHTDLPWRLILVEDASPDPRIRPFLRRWVAANATAALEIVLIENPVNLGFVGAVNRGLEAARHHPHPVILLNADTLVPAAWASRLVAPLADPAVASVTPLSNEAELMTAPVICRGQPLRPGEGDRIDALVAAAGLAPREVPTGVGFCMALSPAFLRRLPRFDPAFGPGYGEEVDWCQRARHIAGRHLVQPALFVEHRGGTSFGATQKARLCTKNGALIDRRYPGYNARVQGFLRDDPLIGARMVAAMAWAAVRADGPVPIYLGHALGGGAEDDLARRIGADVTRIGVAVVLRVGGPHRWQIEVHTPAGVTAAACEDRAQVLTLLRRLPARRVIYSCGVGDPDPIDLPDFLMQIGANQTIEVLFHDYLPLSPSYTLIGSDGHFRGLPKCGSADRAHRSRGRCGRQVDLAEWRIAWGRLMQRAERLVVFSRASHALVAAAFPQAADRIVVQPHRPDLGPLRLVGPPRHGQPPVIGVLGRIGPQKGAGLLPGLAAALNRRGARLVVVGEVDPAIRLPRGVRVTGAYGMADIPRLVHRHGIGLWLIPSVWPETFSFTTHEAIATGLPVACFDLGGQAEALKASLAHGGHGIVLPWHQGPEGPDALADALLACLAAAGTRALAA